MTVYVFASAPPSVSSSGPPVACCSQTRQAESNTMHTPNRAGENIQIKSMKQQICKFSFHLPEI